MVNSSSFDAANNNTAGDRNGAKQARSTQGHETQCGPQSASPVTAATATSCETGSSHATADNSLPCVVAAAIETPTTTKTNSGDGTMAANDSSNQNDSESDDKSSLCCSLPLEKLQGVLPTHSKPDNGSTLERGKSKPKLLCLFCDRSFGSANLRQKHVERVHSAKQNRRMSGRRQNISSTPCIHCDKMSNTEHTLNDLFKHMVAEHPAKYFGCLPCEDRFITQIHLTDHNILNHPSSAENEGLTQIKSETTPSIELVIATPEPEDSIPQKVTRSRLKPKLEDPLGLPEEDEFKKPADVKRKRSLSLKDVKNKTVTIKTSKVVLKRSKRLQAQVKEIESDRRRTSRRVQKMAEPDANSSTKLLDKSKSVSINPYPEFDNFYRIKKITDHSIDNLKINSLTFDDVFDKAFFNRIKCNIEDNLLHHIDGKLFKNEESENRISNFEKVGSQTVQSSSSENYGCEMTLNAITPVAALSLNSQYGEDFESQIEYGSKPSKKKTTPVKKDEIHYKYFTRRKYQASILEQKENRDLSRLDMWTQLVIKERQQKIINDQKSAKEILEYTSGEEYKSKVKREELDRVLDRRGPFEDLKEEISKKAAFDKLNASSESAVSAEVFTVVREVVNEIISRVLDGCEEEQITVTDEKQPDDRLIPAFLNLRPTSSLPEEEIDKSDRIALICSSQETENFELPTNKARRKDEALELTGEWARSRIYICAACGYKYPNLKHLLEHKSLYHANVWVQHYEFVGNQSELYRHLSIPGLGKMGVVEEEPQCKQWRRSDARTCAKCRKQCNSLGELHRHVLECGGDWTWILARKKCKYRPFGAKSRRRRRGLVTRIRRKEKTELSDPEKKIYKYGPRSKPSDAETIQRMLANLPAKRSRRSFVSLRDVIFKSRKRNQNAAPQNQEKVSENLPSNKSKRQQNQRSVNLPSNRRTLRSINKVLSSTILDSSLLRVKRKIKMTNEQRITRQSQKVVDNKKAAILIENVNKSVERNPKINTSKNPPKDNEPLILSNAKIQNKIARKRILNSRLNIKNFFPVKKRNSRLNALYENLSVKSEIIVNPISIQPSRNIPSIEKIKESRRGGGLKGLVRNLRKKNNSPTEDKATPSLVRRPKLTRQQSKESISSDKSTAKISKAAAPNVEKEHHKNKLVKEKSIQKTVEKDQEVQDIFNKEKCSKKIKETRGLKKIKTFEDKPSESKPKTKNFKKKFQTIINNVKKLKLDGTTESQNQKNTSLKKSNVEIPVNPRAIFLELSISEKAENTVKTKETPTSLEAKEEGVMKESSVPAATNLMDFKENPPIPEKIFNLEPSNEEQLQAKGELNFDKVDVAPLTGISKICPAFTNTTPNMSTMLSINVDTSDKTKNLISPTLISPNIKGKIRKPAKGLNDCIAMLTSKLQKKEDSKLSPSLTEDPVPTVSKAPEQVEEKKLEPLLPPPIDVHCQKSECILRIPTFKVTAPINDFNETALDLSKKSTNNFNVINKPDNMSVYFEPPKELQLSEFGSTLNKVIGDVIEHKCKEVLSEKLTGHGWTSVNDIIQKVISSESKNLSRKSTGSIFPKNNVDSSIEAVVKRFSLQSDDIPLNKLKKTTEMVSGKRKAYSTKDLSLNSSEITLTSILQNSEIVSKTVQQTVPQFVHPAVVSNVEPMSKVLEISTIPCALDDNDELDLEKLIPETKLQRILPEKDAGLVKTDENLFKCATDLPGNINKLDKISSEFAEKNTQVAEIKTDKKLIEKPETLNLEIIPKQSHVKISVPKNPTNSSKLSDNKQLILSNVDIQLISKNDEILTENQVFKSNILKRKPAKKRRGRGKKQLIPKSKSKNLKKSLHAESVNSFKDPGNCEIETSKLVISNAILPEEKAQSVTPGDSDDELPLLQLTKQDDNIDIGKKCMINKINNITDSANEIVLAISNKNNVNGPNTEYDLNAVSDDKKSKSKNKPRRKNTFVAKTFMRRARKKKSNLFQTNITENAVSTPVSNKSATNCSNLEFDLQKSDILSESDQTISTSLDEKSVTEPLDSSTPIQANKSHTRRKSKTMKKLDKVDNDLFKDFALVINKKTKRIPPMSIVDDSVCDDSLESLSKTTEHVKRKSTGPDDRVQEMDMELEEIPFSSAIIERDSTANLSIGFNEPSLNGLRNNFSKTETKYSQDSLTLEIIEDGIKNLDNKIEIYKGNPGKKPRNNTKPVNLSDTKDIQQVLPEKEKPLDTSINGYRQHSQDLSIQMFEETNRIKEISDLKNKVLVSPTKRRGRKSKSSSHITVENSLEQALETKTTCPLNDIHPVKEIMLKEPVLLLDDTIPKNNSVSPERKRRGRKPRAEQPILDASATLKEHVIEEPANTENLPTSDDIIGSPQTKRRGRKAKTNYSPQNLDAPESLLYNKFLNIKTNIQENAIINPNLMILESKEENLTMDPIDNIEVAFTESQRKGRGRQCKAVKALLTIPNQPDENKLLKEPELQDSVTPDNIIALAGSRPEEDITCQPKRRGRKNKTEPQVNTDNLPTKDISLENSLEEEREINSDLIILQAKRNASKPNNIETESLVLQKSKELLQISGNHINRMFNSVPYVELSNDLSLTTDEKISKELLVLNTENLNNSVSSNVQEDTKNNYLMPEILGNSDLVTPNTKRRNKKLPVNISNNVSTVQEKSKGLNLSNNICLPKRKGRKSKTIDRASDNIEPENIVEDESVLKKSEVLNVLLQSEPNEPRIVQELEINNFSNKSLEESELSTGQKISKGFNLSDISLSKRKGRKSKTDATTMNPAPDKIEQEKIVGNTMDMAADKIEQENIVENNTALEKTKILSFSSPQSKSKEPKIDQPLDMNDFVNESDLSLMDLECPKENLVDSGLGCSDIPPPVKRKGRKANVKVLENPTLILEENTLESIIQEPTSRPNRRCRKSDLDNLKTFSQINTSTSSLTVFQESGFGEDSTPLHDELEKYGKSSTYTNDLTIMESKKRGRKLKVNVIESEILNLKSFNKKNGTSTIENSELESINISKLESDFNKKHTKSNEKLSIDGCQEKRNKSPGKNIKKGEQLESCSTYEAVIYKNIFEEIEEKPSRTRSKSKAILAEQTNIVQNIEESVFNFAEDIPKISEKAIIVENIVNELTTEIQPYKNIFEIEEKLSRTRSKAKSILDQIQETLILEPNQEIEEACGGSNMPKHSISVTEKSKIVDDLLGTENVENINALADINKSYNKDKMSNIAENNLGSETDKKGGKKYKNNLEQENTLNMSGSLKGSSGELKSEDLDPFNFEEDEASTPSIVNSKRGRKKSSSKMVVKMPDEQPITPNSLPENKPLLESTKNFLLQENLDASIKKPSRGRKKLAHKRLSRNRKNELSSKADQNHNSPKDSEPVVPKSLLITREEISESDLDKQADEEVASLTRGNWNSLVQTDLDESRQSSLSDKGPSPVGARSPSLSPQPEKQEVSKVLDIVPVLNESSDIFDLIKKKPIVTEKKLAIEKPTVSELPIELKVPKLSMRELKKSKGLLVDQEEKVPNIINKPLSDKIMTVSNLPQEMDMCENQDIQQESILHSLIESEPVVPEEKIESNHKKQNKKNKSLKVRENVLKLFNSNTNMDFDAFKSSIEKITKPVIKNKRKSKDLVEEIEPLSDILTSSDMDIAPVIDEIDKSLEMDGIYDFEDESELSINKKKNNLRKGDSIKKKSFEKFEQNRRTSNRSAKVKALEHIHDEALAHLLDEGLNPGIPDTKRFEKEVIKKGSKKLKVRKASLESNQLLEGETGVEVSSNNKDHFELDIKGQQEHDLSANVKSISDKKSKNIKTKNSNLKSQDSQQSKVIDSLTIPETTLIPIEQGIKSDSIITLDNTTLNISSKSLNEKLTDERIFAAQADSTKVLNIEKDNNLINAHLFQESNSEETLWNKMFAAAKTQTEILKSPDKKVEHLDIFTNIIEENQSNLEKYVDVPVFETGQLDASSSKDIPINDLALAVVEKPVKKRPGRKSKKDKELLENSLTKDLELKEHNPELLESLKENQKVDSSEAEKPNVFIKEDKIDNQELRRSRRGSQKIISYNENDLIDPVVEAYEKKRQSLHFKKDKVIDKKSVDTVESAPPAESNTLTANVETFPCDDVNTNLVDKIYEFTDSPENDETIGMLESISILRKNKSKQQETTLESGFDSSLPEANTDKTDKFKTPVSSLYCDICKKTFQRIENLIKHKTTLTHISKLSELEAKEVELRNKIKEMNEQQHSLQSSENRDDISISDILESGKDITNKDQTPFSNNETLQLEDIINEVLNKPAIKPLPIVESKSNNYNSYNAECDTELETLKLKSKENYSPTLTKTIAEKQISLLENIIEKTGGNLLGRIFEPSNEIESDDDLRDVDTIDDVSSSCKGNSVSCSKTDILKSVTKTFAKPDQYEEISEDSTSLSTYDDQKSRKILNRDEELFLECCSLLKSGSEVSNFSKKAQNSTEKLSDIIGHRQFVQPEEEAHELYSDNSRTPTPLGDTFDDNASGSNSIASEWNPQPVVGKSFTFKEALSGEPLLAIAPRDEAIIEDIRGKVDQEDILQDRNDSVRSAPTEPSDELNKIDSEEIVLTENKKIITKGARKVFEGLKISIPTDDLDLDMINCHKNDKSESFIESSGKSKGRKSKPTKKLQIGSNVLFKATKKKSPTIPVENNDIYNFEDTLETEEVFPKPDFVAVRTEKSDKITINDNDRNFEDSNDAEAELVSNASSYSLLSMKKSEPIIENITKKKSKAMSKIFKNAAKSRMGEIEAEMRDMPEIPEIDNLELVENYVLSCSQMTDRDATPSSDGEEKVPTPSLEDDFIQTKMTEQEMDQLFDQLIGKKPEEKNKDSRLKNKSSGKPKLEATNKKPETKKADVKNGDTKKKQPKPKGRKRARSDSETDDEFNLNQTKKQSRKKKEEDNVINLEQELRECIGVASRKSQRSCTSGKQNILVEYWSSDDEAFEKMLQAQNNKKPPKPKSSKKSLTKEELLSREIEKTLDSTSESVVKEDKEDSVDTNIEVEPKAAEKKKPGRKKKQINNPPDVLNEDQTDEKQDKAEPNSETITALNRRKRVASNPLYHWSSSSEDDEPQSMVEITSVREDEEDDRPIQHGWIVGDSPKKLVTMLALTKGKKTDVDCVKEQNRKRTGALS